MPGVYIAAWYNSSSTTFTSAMIMSAKSTEIVNMEQASVSRKESNLNDVRAPMLIFISAHAIGSLGFALSLLSIWFGWLLPTSTVPVSEPESAEIKKVRSPSRHLRRPSQSVSSKAPPLPVPIRRSSAPVDLASILVPHSDESQQYGKRVCFADSPPLTPITRRNTMPEPSHPSYRAPSLHQLIEASVSSSSAPSTSQTEEHEHLPAVVTAVFDDLVTQSDSSRPPSRSSFIKPASRFQKLKLGFSVKSPKLPPPQSEQQGDQVSIASVETNVSDKSTKRGSGSFIPPWSITRHRTAPDMNTQSRPSSPARLAFMNHSSTPTTQTNASPTSSTTSLCTQTVDILTRKAQRRTSTPLPRTNPYAAPYFAEPPIPVDSRRKKRSSHPSRTSRPDNENNSGPSAHGSDAEPRGRTRQNSIRRVALNPQPSHPSVKQRSASEYTSQRQAICI
ncbi:hypothetical protein BJ165DRAFT_463529 [Panaeolus papilionaceus]|nr:hypothetical protein BJ165DRAFT_463529 [Panaeolus papilionaceus]